MIIQSLNATDALNLRKCVHSVFKLIGKKWCKSKKSVLSVKPFGKVAWRISSFKFVGADDKVTSQHVYKHQRVAARLRLTDKRKHNTWVVFFSFKIIDMYWPGSMFRLLPKTKDKEPEHWNYTLKNNNSCQQEQKTHHHKTDLIEKNNRERNLWSIKLLLVHV